MWTVPLDPLGHPRLEPRVYRELGEPLRRLGHEGLLDRREVVDPLEELVRLAHSDPKGWDLRESREPREPRVPQGARVLQGARVPSVLPALRAEPLARRE